MAKYPVITAGQRLNASLLSSMLPEIIVKTSTTERASTTTFAIDPDLQFEGEAGATYLVEFNLIAAALAAADIKTQWAEPGDASGLRSVLGPGSSAADSAADNITMRAGIHVFSTSITYNGVRNSNANGFVIQEWSVITMTTGGTVGLNWAQVTSNATGTRVYAGSWMRVTRLA